MRLVRHAAGTAALVCGAAAAMPVAAQNVAPAAAPLAVVVSWTGTPRVLRADTVVSLGVGLRLVAGDRIEVEGPATMVALHRSGRLETLATSAVLASDSARADGLFARTVRTLVAVAGVDARSLLNREGMIRPIPGTAVVVAPARGILLLDAQPAFTWFAVPGASGYRLQLRADGGAPVRRELGPDTVWASPTALAPGTTYEWTVAALPNGRPAAPQRFRIADADERAALARALDELRATGADPDTDGLFLAALIHLDHGFLYAADRMLARVESAGATGADFHRLRADVLAALGDAEGTALQLERARSRR